MFISPTTSSLRERNLRRILSSDAGPREYGGVQHGVTVAVHVALRLSLGTAPTLRTTCKHRQLRTGALCWNPTSDDMAAASSGPHIMQPGGCAILASSSAALNLDLSYAEAMVSAGCLASVCAARRFSGVCLQTAALYPAAVRIAPPPLCHPWSEGRMLGVEVSGHGLGVAVYHSRAVPYMTAVAVAWTQQ